MITKYTVVFHYGILEQKKDIRGKASRIQLKCGV